MASAVLGALALIGVVATWATSDHFRAFGGTPDAKTTARSHAFKQWAGDRFVNIDVTDVMKAGSLDATREYVFGTQMRHPNCPLPMVNDTAKRLSIAPPSGLRVTWLGHSTTLLEIDGQTILTDPQWSERASPTTLAGPKRFHPPPLALADLPHIDAVLISHDHYDHLDMMTVRALAAKGATFHVALGVIAHLQEWGVPDAQIVEHEWWQSSKLPGGLEIVSTPSRHFSGRFIRQDRMTLWTSWSLIGPIHRVFFSGDTGLTETFREIAQREGPFDVALLEIGQWHPSWGEIHLGPRGALEAFSMLGAKTMIPIHWSTFELAMHDWSEPAETLTVEAAKTGAAVLTPMLGEPIEPTNHPVTPPWWRALPPIAAKCP